MPRRAPRHIDINIEMGLIPENEMWVFVELDWNWSGIDGKYDLRYRTEAKTRHALLGGASRSRSNQKAAREDAFNMATRLICEDTAELVIRYFYSERGDKSIYENNVAFHDKMRNKYTEPTPRHQ